MENPDPLATRFEEHRAHLRAVALRMLGSPTEADDAVQEAWLRLSRSDASAVANLGGWLTTVVARVCLDMLRSRKLRSEEPANDDFEATDDEANPDREMILADSIGAALWVVLDTLSPGERLAFVLHDMFAIPFEDIAPILGKSLEAVRQLASRARRRVQGSRASDPERGRQRELVDAFLAASRDGNFAALLSVLAPDVVLHADEAAIRMGAKTMGLSAEIHGAREVANIFNGRAQDARAASIDGILGAVWLPNGRPRTVFHFKFVDDKIVEITLVGDRTTLAELDISIL